MKKSLITMAAMMVAALVPAQVSAQGAPEGQAAAPHFAFEVTEHDFGAVPHSSPKIEHRFTFTNDGTAPLVITRAATSCSCVKVSYGKRPIPPGGKGEIRVVYEVNKKEAGVFYKVIELYSNTAERRKNLIIKGNAVEDAKR